jgi:hypothetical protein
VASSQLDSLFSDLLALQQQSSHSLPPVHLWNPPLSGDMDLQIDRQGRWIHEGDEIKRAALVKLFASILVREKDEYFLLTPVEKWRIKVAVAPLFVVAASRECRDGQQAITLTTSTDDIVVVNKSHPISLIEGDNPLPLVLVRDNIPALIGRNVYYQLIDWALESSDIASTPKISGTKINSLYLSSMGEQFSLGHI